MNITKKTLSKLLVVAAVTLLITSGCAAANPAAPAATAAAGDSINLQDAWVKAVDDGMSAAFGTLENDGPTAVTVVSATTPASGMAELHETVENEAGEMVMRPREGGFTVPAGGSLELAPGGNHIMLMDLTAPLEAGAEASFTLTFSDGSTYDFSAPVKDYSGANETYEGDVDMEMGSGN